MYSIGHYLMRLRQSRRPQYRLARWLLWLAAALAFELLVLVALGVVPASSLTDLLP